jgi:hypothetical protein
MSCKVQAIKTDTCFLSAWSYAIMLQLASFIALGVLTSISVAATFDASSFGVASNTNTLNLGRCQDIQRPSAGQPTQFDVSAGLKFVKNTGYLVNLTIGNTTVELVRHS